MTSSSTRTTPGPNIPSRRATDRETSRTRLEVKGPRSLTLTTTSGPVGLPLTSILVTLSHVPSGNVRCAAVGFCERYGSPEAVLLPSKLLA